MEIQKMSLSSPSLTPSSSTSNPSRPSAPAWWESISKARTQIQSLSSILSPNIPISQLADSDRPAFSLLHSHTAFSAISSALSSPESGSSDDPFCHWLYDTFQLSDSDLSLVVLSYIPLISGLYLSRIIQSGPNPSLAGFEAVILAVYASEVKHRNGRPILVTIPDLSQPSLYHVPKSITPESPLTVAVYSEPLELQTAVKSTKRASIVAAALDSYYRKIPHMPVWSKLDICEFAASWAGQECSCQYQYDSQPNPSFENECSSSVSEGESTSIEKEIRKLEIVENCTQGNGYGDEHKQNRGGPRIPLPWELLQPVLRILGHCLLGPLVSQEVRDAAALTVRRLYARSLHDLVPQALLATRSLIQLDKRTRSVPDAELELLASNQSTPSNPKKTDVHLSSK